MNLIWIIWVTCLIELCGSELRNPKKYQTRLESNNNRESDDGVSNCCQGALKNRADLLTINDDNFLVPTPSVIPTPQPTATPSFLPSLKTSAPTTPTIIPTVLPTISPSFIPSMLPTLVPSASPTVIPTVMPTVVPTTGKPTIVPTAQPSPSPSLIPSIVPTLSPTVAPTIVPSVVPTASPTYTVTMVPTKSPTISPSAYPTSQPSARPTSQPSRQPSAQPSRQPSGQPSSQPTCQPMAHPTVRPSSQPSVQPTGQPMTHPSMQPSNQPASHPSSRPSVQPSSQPSRQPAAHPTNQPSSSPSSRPTTQPTSRPTCQPSCQPLVRPSSQPSKQPWSKPTGQPTKQPSVKPTCQPLVQPSIQPSSRPTSQPIVRPTSQPTRQPSTRPSCQPSSQPSCQPSVQPSNQPLGHPSSQPSYQPSAQPITRPTSQPSRQPSSKPSRQPSSRPSNWPSSQPTSQPTCVPSCHPSLHPSVKPSNQPSSEPSTRPSNQPSSQPTRQPTIQPSDQPSNNPSTRPTDQPSRQPVARPSNSPTSQPSMCPSGHPTCQPTFNPSGQPSIQPSSMPSSQPTVSPSVQPTNSPTSEPSGQPSIHPSHQPSSQPSGFPTSQPSLFPTSQPTSLPSLNPSSQPIPHPSSVPSVSPSSQPSTCPSRCPSSIPSEWPSSQPSGQPTRCPTVIPSSYPSSQPSRQPTSCPSRVPSSQPTQQPNCIPSAVPSNHPTSQPFSLPSVQPSVQPASFPSSRPSMQPSVWPTVYPSLQPSRSPTIQPLSEPSSQPSEQPSCQPSREPTRQPTSVPSLSIATILSATLPINISISVVGSNVFFNIILPYFHIAPMYGHVLTDINLTVSDSNQCSLLLGSTHNLNIALVDHVIGLELKGRSASLVPDINGDGFDDLLIGDPYNAKSYLIFGSSAGIVKASKGFTIFGEDLSDLTGWSVGSAGDVNNDTYNDIIIGAPYARGTGAVYVIYGRPNHNYNVYLKYLNVSRGFAVGGESGGDGFGLSVSGVGDVNADGIADVAVGAAMIASRGTGAVYVLFGNQTALLQSIDYLSESSGIKAVGPAFSYAGYSVSGGGDVNGDGIADVLIGSAPVKVTVAGGVYVLYGSRNVSTSSPILLDTSLLVGKAPTVAGLFVTEFGDVNFDGFADVLAGDVLGLVEPSARIMLHSVPRSNPIVIPSPTPSADPTTLIPTRPTVMPTLQPTSPTSVPTRQPSQPTLEPTEPPTAPSFEPTCVPNFLPRRSVAPSLSNLQSTRAPLRVPSAAPTNYSSVYSVVVIKRGVSSYSRTSRNINFVVNVTQDVRIINEGGCDLFTICPRNGTTLTIDYFNVSCDRISLELFPDLLKFSDLNITAGSVYVNLDHGQRIHILNLEVAEFTEHNIILHTVVDGGNNSPNDAISSHAVKGAKYSAAGFALVLILYFLYRRAVTARIANERDHNVNEIIERLRTSHPEFIDVVDDSDPKSRTRGDKRLFLIKFDVDTRGEYLVNLVEQMLSDNIISDVSSVASALHQPRNESIFVNESVDEDNDDMGVDNVDTVSEISFVESLQKEKLAINLSDRSEEFSSLSSLSAMPESPSKMHNFDERQNLTESALVESTSWYSSLNVSELERDLDAESVFESPDLSDSEPYSHDLLTPSRLFATPSDLDSMDSMFNENEENV